MSEEVMVQGLPPQLCFWINGFMICNYVIRKGKVIQSKIQGKFLKFPSPRPNKESEDVDLINKKKNELPSKVARPSR